MKKRILITGGAGAIGSTLANQLSKNPDNRIVVLDNLSSGHVENLKMRKNVRFIQGSVESDEDLNLVWKDKIHAVFHLAANFANQNSVDFPQRDLQINGLGTLKLLLKAVENHVERFIYTSSSCVYGNRREPLAESCREFSLDTPYAITKLLGEQYVHFFVEHHGLKAVILRYFNVYGPNEYPGKYRNVIGNFLYKAIRNEEITVTGTGEETRDFNYVDDTVRATILASQKEKAVGQVLNIASGIETSVNDLVEHILEITQSKSKVVHQRKRLWDSVTRRVAATERAFEVLGYRPEVLLRDGLKKYYQWLKKTDLDKCEW
ncbi:MAG: NAD-dependent epimerase/dehydratase family protein [Candidatus Omnitrophica bacterium]|nr:NAD-dependent epimerase/dehydratase family protein [Candidatus Omnitrophota bacterium]